jgi:hypothetical protein
MKRAVEVLLVDARQRGDLYAETIIQMHCGSCALLADDKPDEALRGLSILRRWSNEGFHVEHLVETHNQVEIALYMGNAQHAVTLIEERWPALTSSLLLRVEALRIQMLSLRARGLLAAAAAARTEIDRKRLLASAERERRALRREPASWAIPLASLLDASSAVIHGRRAEAISFLERAESECLSADLGLHAAAAVLARGMLLGAHAGSELVGRAEREMSAEGINVPARIAAVMVPGVLG